MRLERVLFVTGLHLPEFVGGVQLYTHDVACEMLARKNPVQVLCAGAQNDGPSHLNGVTDDTYEGVPIRRLNLNWRKAPDPFRYLYDNPITGKEIDNVIRQFKPTVVHITYPAHLSFSAVRSAKLAGIPVVISLCDFWCICPRYTLQHADGHICDARVTAWDCTKCLAWNAKIYHWPQRILPEPILHGVLTWTGRQPLLARQRGLIGMIGDMDGRQHAVRWAFEATDVVLAVSTYVRDIFVASGQVPVDRIRVLTQGVPKHASLPPPARIPAPGLRVAYFGRVAPNKGIDILIQAFSLLQGDVRLTINGNSDDSTRDYDLLLRSLARGDSRITFAGPYSPQVMSTLLAQTDVVVVPSIWPETYCFVAREALINRVPVIGSHIGAIPDAVVHEVTGLLVEPGDVQGLTTALQRFIDDRALHNRLANNILPQKTIAQECDELLDIYKSLTTHTG